MSDNMNNTNKHRKERKKYFSRLISFFLSLALLTAATPTAAMADEMGTAAASLPGVYNVYINVDGSNTPAMVASYSAAEMRNLAKLSKNNYAANDKYQKMTANGTIYYTAYNPYGSKSGRVATEYVLIEDLFDKLGISMGENDYLITGPDYTIDSQYQEYNFGSAAQNYQSFWSNYGWFNYDDLFADRYYFRNWNENDKLQVPAIIALKSYGGDNWTEEGYWNMYAGSADYERAYMVNFGQKTPSDAIYNRYYYQTQECTVKFAPADACEKIILTLLAGKRAEADELLTATVVSQSAADVSEGSYWVTQAQYNALAEAVLLSEPAASETNQSGYNKYLALRQAVDVFNSYKQVGTKSGYAWFEDSEYETTDIYVLNTLNQIVEFANIVNGVAELGENLVQHDFAGKTVKLGRDIDLGNYKIIIGTEENPFAGTFDGANHELSNLRINNAMDNAALFAFNNGTIQNLTVSGTVVGDLAAKNVAGLAANNEGIVTGCVNKVNVSAENADRVGGLVGCSNGTVSKSANLGNIVGKTSVGGVAGYAEYTDDNTDADSRASFLKECINSGDILAVDTDLESKSGSMVGGIAGGVSSAIGTYVSVESCVNFGNISTNGKTAGGIIGGA